MGLDDMQALWHAAACCFPGEQLLDQVLQALPSETALQGPLMLIRSGHNHPWLGIEQRSFQALLDALRERRLEPQILAQRLPGDPYVNRDGLLTLPVPFWNAWCAAMAIQVKRAGGAFFAK